MKPDLGRARRTDRSATKLGSAPRAILAALAGKRHPRRSASIAKRRLEGAARGQGAATTVAPSNAYLDLEEKKIYDDKLGPQGLDVWASLPRLEAAARQAAPKVELVNVSVPAAVTRRRPSSIDDISVVLGHHLTKFPATDRDRNFNLTLAASKINGVVLPSPARSGRSTRRSASAPRRRATRSPTSSTRVRWSMVSPAERARSRPRYSAPRSSPGSTSSRRSNHSRPSAYTPLGSSARPWWRPNVDLKLEEPVRLPGRDPLPRRQWRGAGRGPRQAAAVRQGRVRALHARVDAVRGRGAARCRRSRKELHVDRSGRVRRLQARALPQVSTRATSS